MTRPPTPRGGPGRISSTSGLPFLETFAPKRALAAGPPPFAIIMRQANGVAQQHEDEPERFWPKALGALTKDGLASQGDRALSLLSDYADKLLVVRGVKFGFPGGGCAHSGGGNHHGWMLKHLLDRLSSYTLGSGTLLDSGVAVWTNDIADRSHSYSNIPHVLAGGANGFLKTGQYIDAGDVTNNKMWNVVGSAVGCRNNGKLMDNLGDPSLQPGFIEAMMA